MARRKVLTRRGSVAAICLIVGLGLSACSKTDGAPEAPAATHIDLACPSEPLSPSPLRRLTRFEYGNVVSDVFGTELPVDELFPLDEVALGFDNQGGTLGVTDLHVEGYLDAATNIADFVVADPARLGEVAGCTPDSITCVRQLAARLGERLKRRPLGEDEVELLVGEASDVNESAFEVIATLLQSPEFLYRFERRSGDAVDQNQRALAAPPVLASRLSFLIWGSVPDQALLDAAASLTSKEDVEREARRLLADERARRGILHFYLQWLGLSNLALVEKDQGLFARWDETLRDELGRETRRFLEAVLWEDDASFRSLLTAPYTFGSALVADHYDLDFPASDGDAVVRLDFPRGTPRQGLLTHGSILAAQAKPNQTDPIHRGKFVRERFFCTPPEPPPPDLVVSPPTLDPRKTTRERFAEHRADPSCAGCHELLDPVGLIFEHYDAIGRYRATENGAPVDATGYLDETDIPGMIDGVPELADELAESAEVSRCIVTQWFRYAFGRGESDADQCTLDRLDEAFTASGGDLAELVVALTQTDPFLLAAPSPESLDEDP